MPYLPLDDSLVAMIRENEAIIRGFMHCGGGDSLWDADIAWDFPAQATGDAWDEDAAKLSHAIGFIAGVAAAMDVTPLELLDVVLWPGRGKPVIEVHTRDSSPALSAPTPRAKRTTSQRRQRLPKVR